MKAVRRTKRASIEQLSIMTENIKEVTGRAVCLSMQTSSWIKESYQIYISDSGLDKGDYIIAEFNTWEACQKKYSEIVKGGLYGQQLA